ncbi:MULTISPECIES: very short patch repair endonuclease [Comamonas]|uniref:very short patch repair endonuclease n=1 Tax=Comamonas TaxID=283 RepID=UPI0021B0F229|nr:very short patch repair endonuclease [Comamonas aquatica]MDE1557237.1 very short patch repair endonuclease [Comamonas aquatica]MDH0200063.1 very short patch repair endonuclease [Comamonas aquatica]MDH0371059.1 very short patch repair endonuclease [Comamonas aquatica]MDH1446121.1 very short patch repair endonuclease [Comamonas aquatica]
MKKKARNSGDNDVDPARSAQMALVRGRDTKPEIRVRKALHAAGLRYRLHDKKLPGSPDLVFPGQSVRASHADMTRSVSTQNGIEPCCVAFRACVQLTPKAGAGAVVWPLAPD